MFTFLGALVALVMAYVLVTWPSENSDAIMLVFPISLLVMGSFLLCVGLFASDERVIRVGTLMSKWG